MNEAIKLVEKALEILKSEEKKEKVILGSLKPGETFLIGEHEFIVLEQNKDGTTSVISKNLMAENAVFDEKSRDYNKSSLKKLIEGKIRPVILENVGDGNLVEHTVYLTSVDNQNEFGSLTCDVRPLTFDEARKYNDFLVNKDLPKHYWTIAPWSTAERGCKYFIVVVSPAGNITYDYCNNYYFGVRPFCILKSNIFVLKGKK